MAIRYSSYLKRNRFGIYYFRAAVPQDLRPYIRQREIHRSLHTSVRLEAASRVMIIACRVKVIFKTLRTMPKKTDKPLQVDMIEMLDLTDMGLGKATWDYDISNPDEVALVERRRQEMLQQAAGRPRLAASAPTKAVVSTTLSELFKSFCADKRATNQWRDPETAENYDYGPHIKEFISVVGDKPISTMTAGDARDYRAVVLVKKPESRGNKVKRLNRVNAFLNWARQQQHTTNDFSGILKIDAAGKANRSYEPFTSEDLTKLFHSVQYRNAEFVKASQYWIPLIGLYTGSRINEIAQLYLKDVTKVDGIDAFDINDEGDKTTKNLASKRTVPVHPELRKAGFFDYVDLIRSEGYERLFPELKKSDRPKDSFGREPSAFFTDYRRVCEVVTEGEVRDPATGKYKGHGSKVFHSLRTTANSKLRQKDVPQERRERLVGHESDGVNNSVYRPTDKNEMFSFQTLYDDLCKLDYGLTHAPYIPTEAHRNARLKANKRSPVASK